MGTHLRWPESWKHYENILISLSTPCEAETVNQSTDEVAEDPRGRRPLDSWKISALQIGVAFEFDSDSIVRPGLCQIFLLSPSDTFPANDFLVHQK